MSRRKFIGSGASVVGVGLAGCSGDGGDSSTPTPTSGGGGGDDTTATETSGDDGGTFTFVWGRPPQQIQLNVFSQGNYGHSYRDMIQHYIAYGMASGGVTSGLVDNFSAEGTTLTLEFNDQFTWWSGEDLTAEDYWTFLEIDRLQNPEKSNYAEHNLVDDYTLERVYKNEVTPSLMKGTLTSQRYCKMCTPRWIYGEYLESLQDATSQDERDSVTEELQSLRIPVSQVMNEGLGNGLFEIVDVSETETILEKYEDHPHADQTDIQRAKMIRGTGMENRRARTINNEFDMDGNALITAVDRGDYPDNLQNWAEISWFRTQKLMFDWTNKHLARRPVRRAIAHALAIEPMVQAVRQEGLVGTVPAAQSGLRTSIHETYLGEGWDDQLIEYPNAADRDTATTLMEEAGYTKSGGVWEDEEGDSVSLSMLNADNHSSALAVLVTDQLDSFGFEMENTTVGYSDFYSTLENYEHDIYWNWHVAQALWHPIAYFSNNFYGVHVGDPDAGGDTGPTGIPFERQIPNEVGATEISGSGQTIEPAQLMADLQVAQSEEEVTNLTRTLVQWFNFDLPHLVWIEENTGSWGDVEDYSFPEVGDHDGMLNVARPGQEAFVYGHIDRA